MPFLRNRSRKPEKGPFRRNRSDDTEKGPFRRNRGCDPKKCHGCRKPQRQSGKKVRSVGTEATIRKKIRSVGTEAVT